MNNNNTINIKHYEWFKGYNKLCFHAVSYNTQHQCSNIWLHDTSQLYRPETLLAFEEAAQQSLNQQASDKEEDLTICVTMYTRVKTVIMRFVKDELFVLLWEGQLEPNTKLVAHLEPGDVIKRNGEKISITTFRREDDICIVTYPHMGGYCGFVEPASGYFFVKFKS